VVDWGGKEGSLAYFARERSGMHAGAEREGDGKEKGGGERGGRFAAEGTGSGGGLGKGGRWEGEMKVGNGTERRVVEDGGFARAVPLSAGL
jgi:hypothetical protein